MRVIIEIPKGDDRRRHLSFDKKEFVDLGPIKDKIPVNNGIMPIDYGYIPGTENKTEKDEVDVLLISLSKFGVGDEAEAKPIALMKRDDGDDKVVAVDNDAAEISWDDLDSEVREKIINFFGYAHKFTAIESAEAAIGYIDERRVKW